MTQPAVDLTIILAALQDLIDDLTATVTAQQRAIWDIQRRLDGADAGRQREGG